MITDQETNFVYFSKKLIENGFESEYKKIISILDKYNIQHGLIEGTADIWCRDYMPIQLPENKFIQFRYEPSYLNKKDEYKKSKSNPAEVCKLNNIEPKFSEINLDGGNVIKYKNKVILTDRIFDENKGYDRDSLIKELTEIFEAEIFIIPQINSDMTGHADGLVRFFNNDTILVNELKNEYKYWQTKMNKFKKNNGFNFIEIPWFIDTRPKFKKEYNHSAIGNYINFLEVGNLIIIPKYEIEGNGDEEAFNIFKRTYPNRNIESVEINEIAKHGGVLNCISWNVKK